MSQYDQQCAPKPPSIVTNTQNDVSAPQDTEKPPIFAGQTPRALIQATIEFGLIIVGLLSIYLFLPRDTGGDGWLRFQDLLKLSAGQNPTSKYSIIGPLFSYPLLLIGNRFGQGYAWITVYNFVLFCCVLLITYLLLRKNMDRSLLRKFFLILIIASMFTANLAFFYGEVFTALCVGMGILIVYIRYIRFATPAGWVAIILGVANTPATIVGLAFMMLKQVIDSKRLRYLLIIVAAGACIVIESLLRYGSIFGNGYGSDSGAKTFLPYSGLPGFSYPFFFGLISILFSFGKGLIFFAPGLLLPIRKTLLQRQEEKQVNLYQVYTLWICFVIGLIMVYSRWWAWYGGQFWGPRFFLIASLPASLALAIRLQYRKDFSLLANLLTLLVFCLSVWVGIDGAVFQWATAVHMPGICGAPNYQYEMICYYIPEFSPLWYPFVTHIPISIGQMLFIIYSVVAATYLITPLLIHVMQQIIFLLKRYSRAYLDLKLWRI
jgi:hypothetical protein